MVTCHGVCLCIRNTRNKRNATGSNDAADREHIASGVSPRTVDAYARVTFDFERTLEI